MKIVEKRAEDSLKWRFYLFAEKSSRESVMQISSHSDNFLVGKLASFKFTKAWRQSSTGA